MAIKIIKEPDIVMTQEEHDRLFQEYQRTMMHTYNPVSFETWVRSKRHD